MRVSPNRMELLRMKKQQLAQRSHKLLKDKLEGLLKDFTERGRVPIPQRNHHGAT